MSGAQTSGFPNQNDLMTVATQNLANYYAPERNRLFVQEAQQKASMNEMEVMSRIAGGLMNLREDQREAAYPGAVRYAQSLGYAKNAPPVYPGHAATQQLASLGIPAADQYKLAADRSAKQALFPDAPGTGTGTGTAGSTPAVPGGAYGTGGGNTAQVPAELMPHFQEASARTGIPVDVLIAQARQESSFNANAVGGAGEIGIGQILPSTARSPGYGIPGVDPAALKDPRTNINFAADYLKALLPPGADPKDPAAIRAALLRYNGGGDPNYVNNVTRYLPAPGGGVAARTGGVNVAGPGAPTATLPAAPAAGGTVAEQPGNQGLINRLASVGGAEPVVPAPAVVAPAVPAAPAVVAPAATPAVPDLPVPQAPNIQANGFTPDQTRWLKTLRDNPSVSADELRKAQDTLRTQNTAAVEKYQADVKAYRADVLAQQKAAREAAGENDPIQGKDEKANADRTLFKYVDKILEDRATTEERRLYAQAAQHYLKPHAEWVDDPSDPSKKVQVNVPGQLPEGFPHPSFKPGEAPKPPPVKAAPALTESQTKAASWSDRLAIANPLMDKLDNIALTWAQTVKEKAGNYAGYSFRSPDFEALRTAQKVFLGAVLHSESGAAASDSEWEQNKGTYFPQPGEAPETIKLKQQFRQSVWEGMQRSAGPGYKLPVAGAGGTTSTDTTAKPPPGLKIIIQ